MWFNVSSVPTFISAPASGAYTNNHGMQPVTLQGPWFASGVVHCWLVQLVHGRGPEFAWRYTHYFGTGSLGREFKLAHENRAGAWHRIRNRRSAANRVESIEPTKNVRYQTILAFGFLKSNFSPGPPVPLLRVCVFNAWVVATIVPSLKTSTKTITYHLVLDFWLVTIGNKIILSVTPACYER